jgi:hypothetical protein
MNQSISMAGVGDQEDITTVDLMATSSVMEASCALPIDGVGGTRGDDEDQLTQVVYSFRWYRFSSMLLFGHEYSAHIFTEHCVSYHRSRGHRQY